MIDLGLGSQFWVKDPSAGIKLRRTHHVVRMIDRLGRGKVILAIWFILIGWITWEMSPFDGGSVIGLFIVSAYVTYLLTPRWCKVSWVIVLYVVSWLDILGTATWHDATTRTYASAQCGDGSYSYSAHRQGTCSWHHGVRVWEPEIPPWWKTL